MPRGHLSRVVVRETLERSSYGVLIESVQRRDDIFGQMLGSKADANGAGEGK